MFIQTSETPNPQSLKFIPGTKVLKEGTLTYNYGEDSSTSPLATELFTIEGVKGIFFTDSFITITKDPDFDWVTLKPLILATMVDHFTANKPVVLDKIFAETEEHIGENNEITDQIKELIESRVRPAVAQDGGDIIYKGFKEGTVYLELHGSCSGCPSSTITLKSGIENMLKHYIPEVKSVEAV